ncbi:MAG: purine-nucleoside phosphorylase [Ginsengibacter sp.]
MDNVIEKIKEAAAFLHREKMEGPSIGIVLGTGLGKLTEQISNPISIPYVDIRYFAAATVESHKGQLIFGKIGKKKVIVMQGRFHYYEGYSMQEITFPVRVMKTLGVQNLILSNAAGGINNGFKKGDLILIDDHINLLPENPLRGLNDPAFGNRFVDMFCPYDKNLVSIFEEAAGSLSIHLKKGIYAAVAGPNLETRAEYRYIRSIGADMVGMSTVPEVIVANHIGLKCAAISVITDECDPDHLQPVNIEEIIKVAGEADRLLSSLIIGAIEKIGNVLKNGW